MTLPDLGEYNDTTENTMPSNTATDSLGKAVVMVLQQAASQGRITSSLTSCVHLLSIRPDDVMLCILPNIANPDPIATIQSTLIRAVCQEHGIRVLSVDCDVKLTKAVCMSEEEIQSNNALTDNVDENANEMLKTPCPCKEDTMLSPDIDNLAPITGFPCVLVEYPKDGSSAEEEVVAEYFKEHMYGALTGPYIELPD